MKKAHTTIFLSPLKFVKENIWDKDGVTSITFSKTLLTLPSFSGHTSVTDRSLPQQMLYPCQRI